VQRAYVGEDVKRVSEERYPTNSFDILLCN